MQPQDPSKLAKWLDKLQRESWQLELIISGFAIFLMANATNWLNGQHQDLWLSVQGLGQTGELVLIGYNTVKVMCFFILLNLILHVMLRGVWISTIGLRYVSGDIDFDSLRLGPKFDRFLRRKIGSFDQYILQLENICSIVFAFTFLIVFMVLGVGLFIIFSISFLDILMAPLLNGLSKNASMAIGIPIIVFLLLSGLLYFIDFLSLGFLKRVKWLSVFYMPIYRFMSIITLSALYRPIYYNLIDNKFGRRVGLLLVPYVAVIMFLMSERVYSYTWYPDVANNVTLLKDCYDDQRTEDRLIYTGSIASKFISNGFLEMFILYAPQRDNEVLEEFCPDFKPFHEAGIASDIRFNIGKNKAPIVRTLAPDTALTCFSQLYEVFVNDSLFFETTYRFHRHGNNQEHGLVTLLDVSYLERGEHLVKVNKWHKGHPNNKDSLVMKPFFQIPFWVE